MSGDHDAIEKLKRDDERIDAAVLDVWEIHHHDRDPAPGTAEILAEYLRDLLAEAETVDNDQLFDVATLIAGDLESSTLWIGSYDDLHAAIEKRLREKWGKP